VERAALRQLLRDALEAGLDALADGLAAATAPRGPVRMVAPGDLLIDPRRFQFRQSVVNLSGTDGRLRDACRWNQALAGVLLVWPDPGGRLALVDGHHRHRLALANAVPAVAVLEIEARDAIEARTVGALSNLANGTATAPDLAKLLRDRAMGPADVAAYGVSPRSRVLRDAAALVPLAPDLFARVAAGELPLEVGLALAPAGPPAVQRDLACEAHRRRWSAEQISEAAKLAQLASVTTTTPTGCLPGLEALMSGEASDLGALLAVRAQIRRQLAGELQALAVVARKRSAVALEDRGVAVVDREAAADARDSSRAQARLFDRLAGMAGPLQACIRRLAAEVQQGRAAAEVVAAGLGEVRAAIEAELGGC
jgi:hypothetical protein